MKNSGLSLLPQGGAGGAERGCDLPSHNRAVELLGPGPGIQGSMGS